MKRRDPNRQLEFPLAEVVRLQRVSVLQRLRDNLREMDATGESSDHA